MVKFEKFHLGIARSRAKGGEFDNIVNCDVHDEIGYCKPQLALESVTDANAPTEPCWMASTPSDTVYFFSNESGKIWKRTSAGVWSSLTSNSNGAHRGAYYFDKGSGGEIIYWTTSKIGSFVAETEAGRNDSWKTSTNGQLGGFAELNLALWIADGDLITKIDDSGTFTANALDIPKELVAYSLIADRNNLLIGSSINGATRKSVYFSWDTYSDSWTLEDTVYENGANTLLNLDNVIITQCGRDGKLFYWTGERMANFSNHLRRANLGDIPVATWGSFGHQYGTVFRSKPLIAYENKVFSIYNKYSESDFAIVNEYTPTEGGAHAILVSGEKLYLSRKTGVDIIGTYYADAYLDTIEVSGTFKNVIVEYDNYPEGIGIGINVNRAGYVTTSPIIDTKRNIVYFNGGIKDCRTLQARINFAPSGSNIPIIKSITFI